MNALSSAVERTWRRPDPAAASQEQPNAEETANAAPAVLAPAVTLVSPHLACLDTVRTLARLLHGDDLAVGVYDPAEGGPLPAGALPVITAASTARAVQAAARMATAWSPQVARPALLVAADAPVPAPRIVEHRIRTIEQRVLGVARLGYLPRLREVDDPLDALAPRRRGRASPTLRRVARLRRTLAALAPAPTAPTPSTAVNEAAR